MDTPVPTVKNYSQPLDLGLAGKVKLFGALVALLFLWAVYYAGRPAAPTTKTTATQSAEATMPTEWPVDRPTATVVARPAEPRMPESPRLPATTGSGGGPSRGASDALREEQQRRAYASLSASTLVGGPARAGSASSAGDRAVLSEPSRSMDAEADAAVRAWQRATGQTASVSAPPVPVASSPALAASTTRLQPTPPITDAGPLYPVLESTILDGVLLDKLDGSSASPVVVLITNPLYSFSGKYVLVPAGTKVVGESKPVQAQNESRLAVTFHRLIFPDGRTHPLGPDLGLDQAGDTGIHDQVNNHVAAIFGASAAVGLIQGLSQAAGMIGVGSGSGDNRSVIVLNGAANNTSTAANQVMARFTNRLPTVTIRPGHRIKVYVTKDLELPAYRGRTS